MKPMTVNVPDEYIPLNMTALEHQHAYTRASQREDARYLEAADWFKRKRSARPSPHNVPVPGFILSKKFSTGRSPGVISNCVGRPSP